MDTLLALTDIVETNQLSEHLNKFGNNRSSEREKQLAALDAISIATRETRFFLQETNKDYVPSKKLSELWYAAFRATLEIKTFQNDPFIYALHEKSKFWVDPKTWFINPPAMGLVPKLLTIEEKCDFLIKELTKSQNE